MSTEFLKKVFSNYTMLFLKIRYRYASDNEKGFLQGISSNKIFINLASNKRSQTLTIF